MLILVKTVLKNHHGFFYTFIANKKKEVQNNKATLMNKSELLNFLNVNGKFFVQFFCPIFGVLAQECYQVLKDDNYKFKKILPKLVLAWFVCLILGAFIEENKTLNKFYPHILLILAAGYRIAADFIFKDLLPNIFQIVLKYLNSKNQQKDE